MSIPIHCVACGEPIKGGLVNLLSMDPLVVKEVTEPGPHCGDCYATACEEFTDLYGGKS